MEHIFSGTVTNIQDRTYEKDGTTKHTLIARIEELNPTNPDYPEALAVEFFKDEPACPNVGETVTVTYNVKARVYKDAIYGSNSAWKVARLDDAPQNGTSTSQSNKVAENGLKQSDTDLNIKQPIWFESDPSDDLPF